MLALAYRIQGGEAGECGVNGGGEMFLNESLQFNLGRWDFWRVLISKTYTELFVNNSLTTFFKIHDWKVMTDSLQVTIQMVTKESDEQSYSGFIPLKMKGRNFCKPCIYNTAIWKTRKNYDNIRESYPLGIGYN